MKNWDQITIRKAVEIGLLEKPLDGNHGEIHPKGDDFVDSGIPFIMASDIKNGKVDLENCSYITNSQAQSLRKGFSINGDVLLTHKATLGEVALLKTNYEFVMLTPQVTYYRVKDKEKLNNNFLKYYFESNFFQKTLHNYAGGSTRAYIGITKQLDLPLILPPFPEQKAIAKVLTAFDDKNELLQAQNKTLETMAQTIFKEWFGKYQIGDELPEGFMLDSLGKVVKIKQGKYVKSEKISEIQNQEFKYPVYGGGGIRGYLQSYVYDTPQVILTCRGNGCGLIQLSKNYSTITNSCMTFEYDNSKLDFTFLYLFSKNINFEIYTSGSAQPQITVTNLEGLEIIIPNEIILKKFKGLVEPLFEKIKKNYYQIKSLKKTIDTLLPKLMSGQVRVNNIKQTADA